MKIRKEVHTRTIFAAKMGEHYFNKMKHVQKRGGNLFSSVDSVKYAQARRIYIHYTHEYQINQSLPLTTF